MIQTLQSNIAASRIRLADSRYSLPQKISTLHTGYRQLLETSIRVLEQSIHGAGGRGTKARAEYLAVVAEGMSKKLSFQHGQLMIQTYSPDAQERLRVRMEHSESEMRAVTRKIREVEEQLAKYGQTRGRERMVSEYDDILKETKKVEGDIARLQRR